MIKVVSLFLISFYCLLGFSNQNKAKKVQVTNDELAVIHTAVGIATIIQLPEAVASVIIGDQGAFKIEYLDKAITIKPLRGGAKTNLYITTLNRRYDVRLMTQNQDVADYVVYLSPREPKEKSSFTWREYYRSVSADDLLMEIKRVGKSKDGFIVIDFLIKSKSQLKIKPEWFYAAQGKDTKVIHSLFLSSVELDEKSQVTGAMTLTKNDLLTEIPVSLELRRQSFKPLAIELSSEVLWRK